MKRKATRRQALATLAITGAIAAAPKLTHAWSMKKRPINSFGRTYDYLKDVDLRLKEIGKKRVTIEDADFSGEEFINVTWRDYDFINCHFSATHNIQLVQMANCNFIECEFGPSRDDDALSFGDSRNSVFSRCKFIAGNVGMAGNARFEQCEFEYPVPQYNHGYSIRADDAVFVRCKFKDYSVIADLKLNFQDCSFSGENKKLMDGHLRKDDPVVAEFTLSDSTFENAEKILWATKVKNLTMSRCVAAPVFRTQGLTVEGAALFENLSRGFFDLGWTSINGKLHVRDCVFSDTGKPPEREKVETDCIFICAGTVPVETVIERIVCRSKAACNLTSAHDGQEFDLSKPRHKNDIFVVRDCKIPYLKINWLKTKLLRLENCEIGQLEIRDGWIGRLEIKNTKYERLDISRAIVEDYAIDRLASGVIIDTGSNYDKATGKAKKK
jgi:uncharacterized protein YjbI with pentapeptide repeats